MTTENLELKTRSNPLGSTTVQALLALICIFVLGCIFNGEGAFFKWGTHRDMLREASEYGILACGMTLVIISGGIDLAVGSILGLVAVFFSLLTFHYGWASGPAIAVSLLLGILCGLLSGGLIARFKMQPFIATLSMMVLARGFAKYISGGEKISTAVRQADGSFTNVPLPAIFETIDSRILGGNISMVTLIMLACLALSCVLMARMRPGRYLYAIGGGEEASRLSGVPVGWIKALAYGLCGFFSAVAGICHAAQEQQGDPEAGNSYELSAIAIVVIGGTSLKGGRGSILLTFLGILTIGYLEKILSINAAGEAVRLMLRGLIIALAVLLQRAK